jgi:hypothetical protein
MAMTARLAAVVMALALPLDPLDQSSATCVRYWAEARYTVGYDHLVYVANGCPAAMSCVVWTDVNPVGQSVVVRPEESAVVLTFRGSPSRSFTPFVRCETRD